MGGWDEWHTLLFQAALVRGPGVTALVNTGPAQDLGPMNAHWATVLGDRAVIRREPDEFIVDQLARHGVTPDDITHVVLTPLQLYTVSNVPLFPHAQICIAERGWVHFHTTHDHPHDNRATSLPDEILVHLVTEAWPRVRLLADEDELAPACVPGGAASTTAPPSSSRSTPTAVSRRSPTATSCSTTWRRTSRSASTRTCTKRSPPTRVSARPPISSSRSTISATSTASRTGGWHDGSDSDSPRTVLVTGCSPRHRARDGGPLRPRGRRGWSSTTRRANATSRRRDRLAGRGRRRDPLLVEADVADPRRSASMAGRSRPSGARSTSSSTTPGICPFANFFDIDVELWDRVQHVNLRGVFLVTQAFTPPHGRRGHGPAG